MATWVFGYGSLVWDPEFEPAERVVATLDGYARSFCMWSIHHRGSEEEPGLVLALDAEAGAACRGMALRLPADGEAAVLEGLRARELISSAYREEEVALTLADGRRVQALAYVIDRAHRQYAKGLTPDAQAEIIARARGGRGPNSEYLWKTVEGLDALGIEDGDLRDLSERVKARIAAR
ncbi:MAG: gamma-glutamylcyclotransferase [Shimia sp.]